MRREFRWAAILVTLIVGFALHRAVANAGPVRPHRSLQGLPLSVGSWRGLEDALPPDVRAALGVDDYVLRRYTRARGAPVTLYVAYYGHQRLDERVHSPSACLPGGGWLPLTVGREAIAVQAGSKSLLEANRYLIEKGPERQVVLYWFQGRGRLIASDVKAAFYLAFDTLSGRGSDEMLVRVNAAVRHSPAETLAEEIRFVQLFYPRLAGFMAGS